MTKRPKGLHHTRSSTEEFLFNKTDPAPAGYKGDRRTDGISAGSLGDLLQSYPDILFGPAFMEYALDSVKDVSVFGAIAVRIDEDDVNDDNTPEITEILIDTIKIIDDECKNKQGIWGHTNNHLLGAFFPDKTDKACLKTAKNIQKILAKIRPETITIGVASYPLIHFKKEQIFNNACKALDHAAFFGPNSVIAFDAISLNISGDILYQQGDIDSAIMEFQTALKIDPSNINVHNSLGVCYGVKKAYEKAVESFEAAIVLDSKEVMALYNAGLVNILIGNQEKALEYFLKANRMDQNVFELAFQTGRCYQELENYPEAVSFLKKATQMKPASGLAFSCLGECYTAMEMTEEAIQAFKTAIKTKPHDATALSGLGHLFEIQGENLEIATIFCQQSVDISPENGLFRHRLGRLYLKQNLLDDALEAFQMAEALGHDSMKYIKDLQQQSDVESSK